MAPEKGKISTDQILEEAERIKEVLRAEQTDLISTMREVDMSQLGMAREELGYDAPDEVNLDDLVDTRIEDKTQVVTPRAVEQVLPITKKSAQTTRASRKNTEAIIKGEDDRLLVVVGPCSIHDPAAALEYAARLQELRERYKDTLEIVMRFYIEKPRTELGWKGFAYDPRLDESYDINQGIIASRMLACQITHMGMPLASERLNTAVTPQYFNGLITYDAIGARNSTDQNGRGYGSGTSSVIGFKNTPEGSVQAAAEAVKAANAPHTILGVSADGIPVQITTAGNETAHVILRGDQNGPNYSARHIKQAKELLHAKGLLEALVIDVSHGNSGKMATRQIEVIKNVAGQLAMGEVAIRGVMIESNLVGGNQKLDNAKELVYGQSITDECIDLAETETMLQMLAGAVNARRHMHWTGR